MRLNTNVRLARWIDEVDDIVDRWEPSIFIGSSSEGFRIARKIRSVLQACGRVQLWKNDRIFRPSKSILPELLRVAKTSDFAVLVATADDEVVRRGKQLPAMRDNVLFEFGLFAGALGIERTLLLVPRRTQLAIPSDLGGFLYVPYDKDSKAIAQLAFRKVRKRISDVASILRHDIVQRSRELVRSHEYKAARRLWAQLTDLLDLFFRLRRELLNFPSRSYIRALKRRCDAALARLPQRFHREIKLLGVRREIAHLVNVVKRAIREFPEEFLKSSPHVHGLSGMFLQRHTESTNTDKLYFNWFNVHESIISDSVVRLATALIRASSRMDMAARPLPHLSERSMRALTAELATSPKAFELEPWLASQRRSE